MENKVCKNKKCNKVLPEECKYKYCEACRNKQAEKAKNAVFRVTSIFATIGLMLFSFDKYKSKK